MAHWISGITHGPERANSLDPDFVPEPTNENPYPVSQSKGFIAEPSTSAPASPDTTGSGGTPSLPPLSMIPTAPEMTAMLKLRGLQ